MTTKMLLERKRPERYRAEDYIAMLIVTVLALLIGTCATTPAHAEIYQESGITQYKLVQAIAGEAEGLSLYEQQAIAGAIINRGTFKGVYGLNRVHNHVLSPKTRQNAQKALKMTLLKDVSGGATHWLSNWDLKHCRESLISWRHKMRVTLKTKHFTFYKEA